MSSFARKLARRNRKKNRPAEGAKPEVQAREPAPEPPPAQPARPRTRRAPCPPFTDVPAELPPIAPESLEALRQHILNTVAQLQGRPWIELMYTAGGLGIVSISVAGEMTLRIVPCTTNERLTEALDDQCHPRTAQGFARSQKRIATLLPGYEAVAFTPAELEDMGRFATVHEQARRHESQRAS